MSQAQYLNGWDDGYTTAAKLAKKSSGSPANVILLIVPTEIGAYKYYYTTKFDEEPKPLDGNNIAPLLHNGVNFIAIGVPIDGVDSWSINLWLDEHHAIVVPGSPNDPTLVAVVAGGVGTQNASFRCILLPISDVELRERIPYQNIINNTSPEPRDEYPE